MLASTEVSYCNAVIYRGIKMKFWHLQRYRNEVLGSTEVLDVVLEYIKRYLTVVLASAKASDCSAGINRGIGL